MNFEEWYLDNREDAARDVLLDAFEAGAQSQQAKIDELQKLRSLDEMAINQLAQANQVWQIKCDELQARIDKVICRLDKGICHVGSEALFNILTGNKDENY